MTSERRFEQDLPDLLAQLALGPTPDYRDHIVQQTSRMRQRPVWTFPERWLPMSAVTSRAAAAPRIPWRVVGLAALLLIGLAVGTLLLVGSQPRVPAPFGRAANGLVAYVASGDIYTADPTAGVGTAVVTGPETDLAPVWSRDGTHFVFERKVGDVSSDGRLFVARANGRDLVAITPKPQSQLRDYAFSPNGRDVVFTSGPEGSSQLWLAKTDGSGVRQLDVGMGVSGPVYRPEDGHEIVFTATSPIGVRNGIYAVDVTTDMVRPIVMPSASVGRGWVRISPDGSRIAYVASTADPARNTYQVHVASADGATDVTLPMPEGATFQDAPEWSNDGTRLVLVRGYAAWNQDMVLAVVPADGSSVGVETKKGLTGCCDTTNEWAPDDSSILTTPTDLDGTFVLQMLWDPTTGVTRQAPWLATSKPAWQRRAP